ncbi:hypothetical protein C8Q79DRAFT_158324 [Trametes meyenii]|nr:hypothetical protein C8Q79DRAFT_158324 [Trametes meyenii]
MSPFDHLQSTDSRAELQKRFARKHDSDMIEISALFGTELDTADSDVAMHAPHSPPTRHLAIYSSVMLWQDCEPDPAPVARRRLDPPEISVADTNSAYPLALRHKRRRTLRRRARPRPHRRSSGNGLELVSRSRAGSGSSHGLQRAMRVRFLVSLCAPSSRTVIRSIHPQDPRMACAVRLFSSGYQGSNLHSCTVLVDGTKRAVYSGSGSSPERPLSSTRRKKYKEPLWLSCPTQLPVGAQHSVVYDRRLAKEASIELGSIAPHDRTTAGRTRTIVP